MPTNNVSVMSQTKLEQPNHVADTIEVAAEVTKLLMIQISAMFIFC